MNLDSIDGNNFVAHLNARSLSGRPMGHAAYDGRSGWYQPKCSQNISIVIVVRNLRCQSKVQCLRSPLNIHFKVLVEIAEDLVSHIVPRRVLFFLDSDDFVACMETSLLGRGLVYDPAEF